MVGFLDCEEIRILFYFTLKVVFLFIWLGSKVLPQTRNIYKWMLVFFGTWKYFRAAWVFKKEVFFGLLITQEQSLDPGKEND
jgi:hypothetical protein